MSLSCDPNFLISQSMCLQNCIPDGMKDAVMIYLLCEIANGSGGGGGVAACLVAQSGAPNVPCAFAFGLWYDNDKNSPTAGSFWWWDQPDAQWIPFSV